MNVMLISDSSILLTYLVQLEIYAGVFLRAFFQRNVDVEQRTDYFYIAR